METNKVILVLLLSPSLLLAATVESFEKWEVKDYWGKLQPKMTQQVALGLIGEPRAKESSSSSEVWYYQEVPIREGDKIVSRPRNGFLRFKMSPNGFLLVTWEEPDWAVITPRTEAQYLIAERTIEAEKKAEEARLQREEQQKIRMEEAERLSKAQQERLAAQSEQRKAQQEALQQQRLAEQNENNSSTSSKKSKTDGYTFNNIHTKYWFMVGGAFIVTACIITVTMGVKK